MENLLNKKVVLGVTGGIAAYKSAELVRLLIKNGCDVKVIMTKSAMEFVTPLTFQTLSQNTVYHEMFNQEQELKIGHISLARWADLVLIAPASANIIAKIANGIADDLLSTVCLAAKVPVYISPAMNEAMWLNPATQNNINTLKSRNIKIIGPASGYQACGENGPGRMLEPEDILKSLFDNLNTNLLFTGTRIMITAGPTQEIIDPVRYISNRSSGKMGYAIAEKAEKLGAEVTLVSGPVNIEAPKNIRMLNIKSADEMYSAVMKNIKETDIFISTAAVADFKPEKVYEQKYKKSEEDFVIKFIKNPDILAEVAKLPSPPFTVGFSAETEKLLENATIKLKNKKLDMIAANLVDDGKVFGKDDNDITLIFKNGNIVQLGSGTKQELAEKLLKEIVNERNYSKKLG